MDNVITSSIKNGDFELPYAKFGSGKKILVLFPGLYTKSLMPLAGAVANQYKRFTADYTVYFFDRVTAPPQGYSMQDMASDTIRAMDELSLRDCYVLGVSAGGILAQIIAARRPDLVQRLAVASSAAKETPLSKKAFEEWSSLAKAHNLTAMNESFAENVYTGSFYQQYREAILSSLDGAKDEDMDRFAIFSSALLNLDITRETDMISCPILALGAAQDKVFGPEATLAIAERCNGKSYIFEGYGHAAYDEAPDFLDKVHAFFEEPLVLYVNSCVRPSSRTDELARCLLEKEKNTYIQEVNLQKEQITGLDLEALNHRDECAAKGRLDDEIFSYARQFARADEIVISAPYWDLLFPASLRAYIERICVVGLTFTYTESGMPKSLCRAKKLTYVTTAGGFIGDRHLGFEYIKTIANVFFGIEDIRLVKAEGLDIQGADVNGIMKEAKSRMWKTDLKK